MMSRLFWRFFLAIWLTIAGAIAFVVVINSYLGILPPKSEMQSERIQFAVAAIGHLVDTGRLDMARSLATTMAAVGSPTRVTIARQEGGGTAKCLEKDGRKTAFVNPADGQCYLVTAEEPPLSIFENYLPIVLPPLAVLLTSLLSAWLLTRHLVKPVATIRKALAALASGNFAMRIGAMFHGRKDEVASLAHDFDVTAGKLEDLQESQKRLFHDVSHELRSPLSRMQLSLGLLRRNPGKLSAIMPRMEREIERLDSLVEEILTLARLGASRSITAELQAIDVVDLLQAITDDAQFEARARGIEVSYRGPDGFVSQLNGELVYRAIENVIRNALKYSPDGGLVEVTAYTREDDSLNIMIANAGPHVHTDDVERIFQPFVRLQNDPGSTGHGLGLAIARSAIAAHQGEVDAWSNPDGGLTVTIRIPRRNPNDDNIRMALIKDTSS